eukprot:10512991-Alexandrium_andersonii.AAC.1
MERWSSASGLAAGSGSMVGRPGSVWLLLPQIVLHYRGAWCELLGGWCWEVRRAEDAGARAFSWIAESGICMHPL